VCSSDLPDRGAIKAHRPARFGIDSRDKKED